MTQEERRERWRIATSKYRAAHKETVRQGKSEYRAAHKEAIQKYDHEYKVGHRKERAERQARYVSKHPEKKRAWNRLYRATVTGKIIRPLHCSSCVKPDKIQGHHRDYSRPLDVAWLCPFCHAVFRGEAHP